MLVSDVPHSQQLLGRLCNSVSVIASAQQIIGKIIDKASQQNFCNWQAFMKLRAIADEYECRPPPPKYHLFGIALQRSEVRLKTQFLTESSHCIECFSILLCRLCWRHKITSRGPLRVSLYSESPTISRKPTTQKGNLVAGWCSTVFGLLSYILTLEHWDFCFYKHEINSCYMIPFILINLHTFQSL